MTPEPYHTALKGGRLEAAFPVARHVTARGSVAVVHDIRRPLPVPYAACDVFYADLPGRGLQTFNERAGAEQGMQELLSGVAAAIRQVEAPVFLTALRMHERHLPGPAVRQETTLNGVPAVLLGYGLDPGPVPSAETLLEQLARDDALTCIGDFLCGYGRTGRVFAEHGKRFVMSDYNPTCIGYIAAHAGEWERR